MDTTSQAERLVGFVRSLTDLQLLDKGNGQYNHMGATIADAILQAGVRYETVVAPRVRQLRDGYLEARTTSGFW